MTLSENHDLKGKLTILKIDSNNQVLSEFTAHNDITLSGRKLVAQLFADKGVKPVDSILLGTGKKEFDAKDEALAEPIDHSGVKIEKTDITEESERIKLILVGTLQEKEEGLDGTALTEACLYSSGSNVMYNRVQFLPINKTEKFKLTMIWEIIF